MHLSTLPLLTLARQCYIGLPPRSSSSSSYRGSETGAPTTTSGIDSSHSDVFTQAETPFVSPLTRTRSPLHTSPPRRNGGNIFAFSSPPRQTSQDSSRSAVGVWFSNILSSSQNQGSQSSSSSKIPDETASVRSYASGATSPSRFLSRKSVRDSPGRRSTFANVQYGGGTSASLQSQRQAPDQANQLSQQAKPPQGRLGGFDRIFDRALQFFTDADSNVDRSPEDIWLMGVRHDGWRPERSLSPTRSHAERPSIDTISSENYPHVIDSGSGSPRQQTTRQTMLSGARRLSKSSNRTQSSKETSVSPPQKESPAAAKRNRPGDYFKAKARKNVSRDSVPSGHLMDRSHSGSSTSSGPHGSVPVGHTQGDVHNGSASQSHDGNEFPYVNGRKEDDAVSILTFSTETQSTHRGPSIVPAPTSTAQTMGWPPGFYHDFYSRIQLTYRSGFSPLPSDPLPPAAGSSVASAITNMMNNLNVSIGRANTSPTAGDVQLPTGLTSDSGWGCMLRTGQSLLANALLDVHLGRGKLSCAWCFSLADAFCHFETFGVHCQSQLQNFPTQPSSAPIHFTVAMFAWSPGSSTTILQPLLSLYTNLQSRGKSLASKLANGLVHPQLRALLRCWQTTSPLRILVWRWLSIPPFTAAKFSALLEAITLTAGIVLS